MVKKIIFYVAYVLFLSACASNFDEFIQIPDPKKANLQEIKQTQIWWKAYKNETINTLISTMLNHNSEINVARYNLLSAVARYKLINFDMYPSLSGNLGANLARNLNLGTRSNSFSNALNLSYELDVYGKISDTKASKEFSAKASLYELESLKLSLINSTINNAFELVYFNDVEKLLEEYVSNLEESKRIYALKYELGKLEELDLLNIEQSLLNAKQNLLNNQQNKELLIKGWIQTCQKVKGHEKTCETTALALMWRVLIGDLDYTPRMLLFLGSITNSNIGIVRFVLKLTEQQRTVRLPSTVHPQIPCHTPPGEARRSHDRSFPESKFN